MNREQSRIIQSMIYPFIFIVILWLVKIIEVIFRIDLEVYGLQPLILKGLPGILTSPFLHAGFSHLFANSVPLFILASLLFYFYRELAWRVILMVWLLTGLWVWFLASKGSTHVGASGVVYGLASFLFFSGIIRREGKLMAITLLTAFLYGGMVWGVFPQFFPKERISWESHAMGLLAGLVVAIYYRKTGPQRKKYEWEEEDDEDDDENGIPWNTPLPPPTPDPKTEIEGHGKKDEPGPDIRYHYKE